MRDIPSYFRPLSQNGCRRASWHDYHSRSIYMISINRASEIFTPFSELRGIPGNRDWPPTAVPTHTGRIIGECISAIKLEFPAVKILRRVIMPEHLHFVLYNTIYSDYHLGDVINHFKGECTRRFYGLTGKQSEPIHLPSLFEDGYHDRILIKRNQLKRMKDYVSDNPRRRMVRMANPGFFHRYFISDPNGIRYEAYGNIQLLEDFDIEPVKISRKFSAEELRRRKITWMHTVENGGVLVSPFISPGEKRVLDWARDNGGSLILITDNGFGRNYTPKGWQHELCAEGRLLIVAPVLHSTSAITLTRNVCLAMNALAETISAHGLRSL